MEKLANVCTVIFKHRNIFSKENLLMFWCFLMIIDLIFEYYLVKMYMNFYIIAGMAYTIIIGCIRLESLKGLRIFRAVTLVCLYITVLMLVITFVFSLTLGQSFDMMVTEFSINLTLMVAMSIQYILIHEHVNLLMLVPAIPAHPIVQFVSATSSSAYCASTTLPTSPAPSTLSPIPTSITFSNPNYSPYV
ncbi:hypothetical protein B9Z55_022962 [Caenorhabditis nigoni]|uniref:Uncharacterized protein n=2 Tax=Caenorhabditis nigoni TaxID=1611254 RepID=A0A2G5SMF1_9PELO|nr:hypothetical protein B9Z55_022962 [Caenorhabditis nigoni]